MIAVVYKRVRHEQEGKLAPMSDWKLNRHAKECRECVTTVCPWWSGYLCFQKRCYYETQENKT